MIWRHPSRELWVSNDAAYTIEKCGQEYELYCGCNHLGEFACVEAAKTYARGIELRDEAQL